MDSACINKHVVTDSSRIVQTQDPNNDTNPEDRKQSDDPSCSISQQEQEDEPASTTIIIKKRRIICSKCDRPLCICSALPIQPIHLQYCHCIVLQHPHEKKMKNASLPIIQLCFDTESLTVVTSRRFGNPPLNDTLSDIIERMVKSQLQKQQSYDIKNETLIPTVWLVYPSDGAISLSQAVEDLITKNNNQTIRSKSDTNNGEEKSTVNPNDPSPIPFVFVVFLDATWKYAKEMDRANQQYNQYPERMQRVQLDQSTFDNSSNFIPRRFEMFRTPISDNHLSTAECIARVLTSIESSISTQVQGDKAIGDTTASTTNNNTYETTETIFDQVMKPLDLMVQQSKSFLHGSEKKNRKSTQQQSKIG